jgi:8-oxo-dGTP diphosphatase
MGTLSSMSLRRRSRPAPGARQTLGVRGHVVVAAIVRDGERVLLCHRSPDRRWYPNVWDFPGGHVQPGELPAAALQRELLEELGIEIGTDPGQALRRIVRPETDLDLTLFLVTAWTGTVANLQVEEHDDVAWFHPDGLGSLTFADASYLPMLQKLLTDG